MRTVNTLRRTGYFNERHIDPRFRSGLVFAGLGAHPGSVVFRDSSGRHNHGTMQPDFATGPQAFWDEELGRMALQSSAGAEEFEVIGAVGLPTGATAAWTFCFWHRTRNYVSLSQVFGWGGALPETFDTPGSYRYVLQFSDNYYFWGSGADWNTGVAWDSDNEWHHIAFVSDGTNLLLYRDGVLMATTALPSLITSLTRITGFSRHAAAVSSPDMDLTDPLIFNTAKSAADIYWLSRRENHLVRPVERVWGRSGAVAGRLLALRRRAAA